VRASGETIEEFVSYSITPGLLANTISSMTQSEQIRNRLSSNDVQLASDHPLRSIVTVARGEGYAQFGGLPFVAESAYHISRAEYQRRKSISWPELAPGTFVPRDHAAKPSVVSSKQTPGPILATEIIGEFKLDNLPQPKTPKRKRSERSSQ
jgi:hypothetical protein